MKTGSPNNARMDKKPVESAASKVAADAASKVAADAASKVAADAASKVAADAAADAAANAAANAAPDAAVRGPTIFRRRNRVPEKILRFQAAKKTGLFTYQAGRYDRYINIGVGLLTLAMVVNAGMGIHKMAYGYGKKEGF